MVKQAIADSGQTWEATVGWREVDGLKTYLGGTSERMWKVGMKIRTKEGLRRRARC